MPVVYGADPLNSPHAPNVHIEQVADDIRIETAILKPGEICFGDFIGLRILDLSCGPGWKEAPTNGTNVIVDKVHLIRGRFFAENEDRHSSEMECRSATAVDPFNGHSRALSDNKVTNLHIPDAYIGSLSVLRTFYRLLHYFALLVGYVRLNYHNKQKKNVHRKHQPIDKRRRIATGWLLILLSAIPDSFGMWLLVTGLARWSAGRGGAGLRILSAVGLLLLCWRVAWLGLRYLWPDPIIWRRADGTLPEPDEMAERRQREGIPDDM
jgi:hypothetical protein